MGNKIIELKDCDIVHAQIYEHDLYGIIRHFEKYDKKYYLCQNLRDGNSVNLFNPCKYSWEFKHDNINGGYTQDVNILEVLDNPIVKLIKSGTIVVVPTIKNDFTHNKIIINYKGRHMIHTECSNDINGGILKIAMGIEELFPIPLKDLFNYE